MRIIWLTAAHFLAASFLAHRNRIFARFPLIFLDWHFATRTRFHRCRQQLTIAALAHMANILALMIFALEYGIADTAARKLYRFIILFGACNGSFITRAIAYLFNLFIARITIAQMAFFLAPMYAATQQLITLFITADYLSLIALVHFRRFAAAAGARHHRLARWTRACIEIQPGAQISPYQKQCLVQLCSQLTRMTQLCTRMRAGIDSPARFTAAVSCIVSIVRRILAFATEAIIRVRHNLRYVLAGTASPALL